MHKQCTWSHGSIHYQILGKGTAVVLLHGFGEDSSIWKEQVNYLQENYMVIIPDLPGTGASEWNVVNSEWSMVNDVNDSLITIDKLAKRFEPEFSFLAVAALVAFAIVLKF